MYEDDDFKMLHRDFLRGLSVQMGEILTILRGGHSQPSPEVMEKEIEDILHHYLVMEKAGVTDVISETGFLMSRLIDPFNRNTFTHTVYMTQVFVSFFISNLKIMMDRGLLSMPDQPEVEKTWKLSTEQTFLEEELADLDLWNKVMKTSLSDLIEDAEISVEIGSDDEEEDSDE